MSEIKNLKQPSSLTLEICLKPEEEPNTRLPAIISLWNPETSSLILIGQWKSSLIIRSYPNYYDAGKKYREIGLRDALQKGMPSFLTVTSGQTGTSIYVNGNLSKHYSNYSIIPNIPNNIVSGTYLVVGNSIYGKASWNGEVYGVELWDRQLSAEEVLKSFLNWQKEENLPFDENGLIGAYRFNARSESIIRNLAGHGPNLLIPSNYRPFKYLVLSPFWQDLAFNRSSISDISVNIIGFIPFGFFCTMFLCIRKRVRRLQGYWKIFLIGAAISLVIELTQALLPTRHSQMIDVVCNTFGTFLGTYLFHLTLSRFPRFLRIVNSQV